jgi:hypothetical protein
MSASPNSANVIGAANLPPRAAPSAAGSSSGSRGSDSD